MGSWGKVVQDDLRAYLKDIADSLEASDDPEQTQIIVSNALKEIQGKELAVATDVECSRFLEALLAQADYKTTLGLFERLGQHDTLVTVSSKCAAHASPASVLNWGCNRAFPLLPVRLAVCKGTGQQMQSAYGRSHGDTS